jgi:type IV secretion system protein TrbL
MEGQILNTVLQNLLDQISLAYGNLLPVAFYFFYAFATITLVKLGLSYAFDQNGSMLAALLVKLFRLGVMLWTISNLPYLHEVLRDGAIKLGIKAAGGSSGAIDLVLNPSEIAQYGTRVIAPIRSWLYGMSWGSAKSIGINLVNVLFGMIAIILILGAFFYLAYQMFMALVDFYFTSVLAPIFLAFQIFTPTAWMAAGAIRGPIQHAVKLFTMAFIINLAEPWIGSLMATSGKLQSLTEVGYLVLASVVLVALSLKAGTWASGMFSGSPTASAGDLVATTAGVAGIGAGALILSNQAIAGSKQIAGSIVGGAVATGSAAIIGAQLRGATYAGNSPIGKFASMAYGAAQGTLGMALATPKAIQQSIARGFSESVARGIRQGYQATGGQHNTAPSSPDYTDRQAAANVARQAAMYQRIAKAFQEHQDFNKH